MALTATADVSVSDSPSRWEADLRSGCEVLDKFVEQLRLRGIRSFKGDLRGSDGSVLWNLELAFERPEPKKRDEEGYV